MGQIAEKIFVEKDADIGGERLVKLSVIGPQLPLEAPFGNNKSETDNKEEYESLGQAASMLH